jgi:hypothetical protein
MAQKGSLPCSQQPAIKSYPETGKSSTNKINFNIILHLRPGLPSDFFPAGFTNKIDDCRGQSVTGANISLSSCFPLSVSFHRGTPYSIYHMGDEQ